MFRKKTPPSSYDHWLTSELPDDDQGPIEGPPDDYEEVRADIEAGYAYDC